MSTWTYGRRCFPLLAVAAGDESTDGLRVYGEVEDAAFHKNPFVKRDIGYTSATTNIYNRMCR
jgi:hypothetical protein